MYGVNDNVSFCTIKSRLQRKGLICNHRGAESPMAYIEPAILEIVKKKKRETRWTRHLQWFKVFYFQAP